MKNLAFASWRASLTALSSRLLCGAAIAVGTVVCTTISAPFASAQEKPANEQNRQPAQAYTDASGAIQVVGNDGMATLLEGINTLFAQSHPNIRFKMYLHGSSTAIAALTSGTSAFAPMGRDIWPNDVVNFKNTHGYAPVDIKIGYGGWGPREGFKTPPSIYVNQSNTLPGITLAQLRQIFVTGAPNGDIRTWSQIANDPKTVARQIHVYGIADNGGFATAFRLAHFQGLPFTGHYETLPNAREVMHAVATDPNGIGLVGWFDPAKTPGVRLLPIAPAQGQAVATPSQADLRADRYPLTSYLHIYINKPPGQSIPTWLADYLALLLSPAGQAVVAREASAEGGFLPLSESMRKVELDKVEELRQP